MMHARQTDNMAPDQAPKLKLRQLPYFLLRIMTFTDFGFARWFQPCTSTDSLRCMKRLELSVVMISTTSVRASERGFQPPLMVADYGTDGAKKAILILRRAFFNQTYSKIILNRR